MVRNLDLSTLTKAEQANILRVIQRDFVLRKQESHRIGELQKSAIPKDREINSSNSCSICGSNFLWIFNSKEECNVCHLFFCKGKETCGFYILAKKEWICSVCNKNRSVELQSLNWFYSNIKSKFRRHGGAKVLREFYKKKKVNDERKFSDSGFLTAESEKTGFPDSDAEHDLNEKHKDISYIKSEIEKVIATTLIPKIDEIKSMAEDPETSQTTTKELENILEQFFKEFPDEQNEQETFHHSKDDLLWRYLKDHKQYLMMRILKEVTQLQNSSCDEKFNSSNSTMRDAETMTEVSDNELDSAPSCSGSLRSHSSFNQLLRYSKPGSFKKLSQTDQFDKSSQKIIQGVLSKEEKIAAADLNAALSEICEESLASFPESSSHFTTELKFTAMEILPDEADHPSNSSNSSESEETNPDHLNDNWIINPLKSKPRKFIQKPIYLPSNESQSAYDDWNDNKLDKINYDDVVEAHAVEAEIYPLMIKKNMSEVSAQVMTYNRQEYIFPQPGLSDSKVTKPCATEFINALSDDFENKSRKYVEDLNKNATNSSETIAINVAEEEIIPTNTKQQENIAHANKFIGVEDDNSKQRKAINSLIIPRKAQSIVNWKTNKTTINVDNNNRTDSEQVKSSNTIKVEEMLDKAFEEAFQKSVKKYSKIAQTADFADKIPVQLEEILSNTPSQTEIRIEQKQKNSLHSTKSDENQKNKLVNNGALDFIVDINSDSSKVKNFRNIPNDIKSDTNSTDDKSELINEKHKNISDTSASSLSSMSEMDNCQTSESQLTNDKYEYAAYIQESLSYDYDPSITSEVKSRKSICDLVQELHTAGLTGKPIKFNLASLQQRNAANIQDFTSPQTNRRAREVKNLNISPIVNKRSSQINWNVHSFTVDPATYKKKNKLTREVSLTSLILSDNESILSESSESLVSSTRNPLTESLPSVAIRRSIFDNQEKSSSKKSTANKDECQKDLKNIAYLKNPTQENQVSSHFTIPNVLIVENNLIDKTLDIAQNKFLDDHFEAARKAKLNILSEVSTSDEKILDTRGDKSSRTSSDKKKSRSSENESTCLSNQKKHNLGKHNQLNSNSNLVTPFSKKVSFKNYLSPDMKSNESNKIDTFNRASSIRGSITMRTSTISNPQEQIDKKVVI